MPATDYHHSQNKASADVGEVSELMRCLSRLANEGRLTDRITQLARVLDSLTQSGCWTEANSEGMVGLPFL